MRTIVSASQESQFTSIAKLARSVIGAPAGPQGAPCVYAQLDKINGQAALVAKTCDESLDTLLLLPETDPQRLEAALTYLTERLAAIGLVVVSDETELQRMH
ncbi:MAG TPA: hypothetical protein VLJ86_22060 [Ramlibacter sp.]|nr:hypothetical protein [Ramlibacter sp.]